MRLSLLFGLGGIVGLLTGGSVAGVLKGERAPAGSVAAGMSELALQTTLGALHSRAREVAYEGVPAVALRMRSVNAGERLDVEPFDRYGVPRPEAFAKLRHFFRSRRGGEVDVDPRLVELLQVIAQRYPDRELLLISGHREPGKGTSGGSYHVKGQAADIAVPGVTSRELYEVVKELGARGTGLYPKFVHVDVREVPYRWSGR